MGGSKKQTIGYKYYAGLHIVLCHGQIDNISRMRVTKEQLWASSPSDPGTAGTIFIDKPTFFGGEKREGGIVATIDILDGSPTQTQNDYLVSVLSGHVPSYRGVASLVYNQAYLGNNPYLKKWDYRVQRVHKTAEGGTQWYDAKSSITIGTSEKIRVLEQNAQYRLAGLTSASAFGGTGGVPYEPGTAVQVGGLDEYQTSVLPVAFPIGTEVGQGGGTYAGETFDPVASAEWPKATLLRAETEFAVDQDVAYVEVTGWMENGCTVYIDGARIGGDADDNILSNNPQFAPRGFQFSGPALRKGVHTIRLEGFDEGIAYDSPGSASQTYLACVVDVFTATNEAMNPIHILRECITDPIWGMGYSSSDVDDAVFTAAADVIHDDEGIGLCMIWDRQEAIEKFMDKVKSHINAEVFVNRVTGLWEVKLIRDDYDPVGLFRLDQTNIIKLTEFKRPQFGELTNTVTVNYYDLAVGDTGTVTVSDTSLVQEQGNIILTSREYKGFPTPAMASRAAQRDLQSLSTPLITCTIYTDVQDQDFNIGDVFTLDWPDYDVNQVVMRITKADYGDGKDNTIRLTCIQDVFTAPTTAMIPETPIDWENPSERPGNITDAISFEMPYLELVQSQSQEAVDAILAAEPATGYLGVSARRPGGAIAAALYTDSGAGYVNWGNVDFSPSAISAEAIDREQTVFQINSLESVRDVVPGTLFQMNFELMEFVSYTEPFITVKRALLDTQPEHHSISSVLYFWDDYAESDGEAYVEGDSIFVKLAAITGAGEQSQSSAINFNVAIEGRANRPYGAVAVRINNEFFPDTVSGNIVLQWHTRNRLQQTSGEFIDWFDEQSIVPETGTTFEARLYAGTVQEVIDGVAPLSREATELVDPVVVFPPFDLPTTATVEIKAVRDGAESLYPFYHTFEYESAAKAIILRDSAVNQSAASVASIDVPYPTTADKDLLVAVIMHRTTGITPPLGWTEHFTSPAIGSSQKVTYLTATADGTEVGVATFTGASTGRMSGVMLSLENASGLEAAVTDEVLSSTTAGVLPSWSNNPGIYAYHWDFSSASSEWSQTGASTTIGALSGDNLRLGAAFDTVGRGSTVTHNNPGGDTAAVVVKVLGLSESPFIQPTGPICPAPFFLNGQWWSFTETDDGYYPDPGAQSSLQKTTSRSGGATGASWTLENETDGTLTGKIVTFSRFQHGNDLIVTERSSGSSWNAIYDTALPANDWLPQRVSSIVGGNLSGGDNWWFFSDAVNLFVMMKSDSLKDLYTTSDMVNYNLVNGNHDNELSLLGTESDYILNVGGQWVATGGNATATSSDLLTWSLESAPINPGSLWFARYGYYFNGAYYCPNRILAMGETESTPKTRHLELWKSTDLINWTQIDMGALPGDGDDLSSIHICNTRVQIFTGTKIFSSTDGDNWTSAEPVHNMIEMEAVHDGVKTSKLAGKETFKSTTATTTEYLLRTGDRETYGARILTLGSDANSAPALRYPAVHTYGATVGMLGKGSLSGGVAGDSFDLNYSTREGFYLHKTGVRYFEITYNAPVEGGIAEIGLTAVGSRYKDAATATDAMRVTIDEQGFVNVWEGALDPLTPGAADSSTPTAFSFAAGQVIGFLVDFTARTIEILDDNTSVLVISDLALDLPWTQYMNVGASIRLNVGQDAFVYPQGGAVAWNS